ncbi:MAG: hypothetical protein ACXACF_00680 [Candidatus Hermodarchaeia archaeon]|jgi:hypothetical protein
MMSRSRLRTTGYLLIAIFFTAMAAFITPYYLLYGLQPPAYPTVLVDEEFDAIALREVNLEFETDVIFPYTQMIVDVEITANTAIILASYMEVLNSTGAVIAHIIFTGGTGTFSTNWICAQGHYNITLYTWGPYTAILEGRIIITTRGFPSVGWWVCPP